MKKSPERTCVATGETHTKDQLLRFMAGPEGTVLFDVTGKGPGRGAYVVPAAAALTKAIKKGGLTRKLGAKVPETLYADVCAALRQHGLQQLSLARKAGGLAVGLPALKEARQQLVAVILAHDAGQDVQSRVQSWDIPVYTCYGRAQLEESLRQPNIAVCGLTNANFSGTLRRIEALQTKENEIR